ncbi:pilus assembly protein TadG-related protein [Nocardioides currus]|uniref:Putative Flp pilus-assembly TadG-like N-terminal domain-containing protein n=1 Tax=Nocardioides currus TaxID=2133958 RepID=A0A2R7YYY9_9ACTN|nr:pilus assembly protein TadG-related protein [Nocardioides currus]PUA81607.1 hypothetical protein C7S10_05910 [Nocardioides currus]
MTATRSAQSRRRYSKSDERGAVMVLGAILFAFLAIPLCALAIDTARWWVEAEHLQAAADAASTAGVTYMPDDINSARSRAVAVATINGYTAGSGTTVTVTQGDKPTRLKVTISQSVDNFFANAFGIGTSTITRSAVADYNGPAPMGSPCNTFGNEPPGTTAAGPTGSQLPGNIPAGANCTSNPDFWASINGPDIAKTQGERFAARTCAGNEDGCDSANKNTEFDPLGYFYVVRVANPGSPVTIQVYDPASVPTGQQCESRPNWGTSSSTTNNANDWTPADAKLRYPNPASYASGTTNREAATALCTGDNDMRTGSQTEAPTVTSFGLRNPTDTQVPTQGTPITSCAKQYRGYKESEVTTAALTRGNSNYKDGLASVFHQWNTLCTFTPSVAGDYYLQVRSNVKFSGAATDTSTSGNSAIFSQSGDDTTVKGTAVNSFGLRAYSGTAGSVSISAWKSMRIFVNGENAQTSFNLVRVVPAAQGKTLNFGFFDVGEGATSSASMRIVPPADSNMSSATNCKASGFVTSNLPTCSMAISTAFNGKQQYMKVPIPNNYTCTWQSQGGCWWRVTVDFGGSNGVHDATTWTAEILGEPIRLVE